MVDSINELLTPKVVNPVGEEDRIVLAPEKAVTPPSHAVLIQPLKEAVNVVGVEFIFVGLKLVPLHGILGNSIVEVLLGKVAVGIITIVEASLDWLSLQSRS